MEYLNKFSKFFKDFLKRKIEEGDIVKVINFNDLSEKQLEFLRSKDTFKVVKVCDRTGAPYTDGTKYFDVGYTIPLLASRFKKVISEEIDYKRCKYKVLFLAFDIKINTYGEEDVTKMFRGCQATTDLFPKLFAEKEPGTKKEPGVYVKFANYDDIHRFKNEYYCEDINLKEFDFVFFGFMAAYTNIANLLINYATRNNIPHMKYETYAHFHNKAYQFDLLETLGYPYIPSIMTTKLSKDLLKKAEKEFGYPMIVKDVYLDRGEGVWKMKNREELTRHFSTTWNRKLSLIQKFIPNDGEWRVITIKNKVALIARKGAVEDISKRDIDERKSKKGDLPQNIKDMCEDVSKHLFSDIIGFDIIQDLNTKKYYIIETNASPHFSMFSVVTNVSVPGKIVDYIMETIKK